MVFGGRRKRKRGNYKFTEKKQSKRGIAGCLVAAVSIGIFIYVVWNSYTNEGAGSMYLGSAGVASLLLAIVATVLSVKSLKEENSFKLFPYMGTITSITALVTWLSLYVMGIILA